MDIRRIEAGNNGQTKLILEASQTQLEKLAELYKSGKLNEVLGIQVEGLEVNLPVQAEKIASSQEITNLTEWFDYPIAVVWKTVEEILGITKSNLLFAARSVSREKGIVRAKQIDLKTPEIKQSLGLIVDIKPAKDQKLGIVLQLHPLFGAYLPKGLIYSVIDDSSKVILTTQAQERKNWLQINLEAELGDKFSVQIKWQDVEVTEQFIL